MKEIHRLDGQGRIYVSNRLFAACGFKFPNDESTVVWGVIGGSGQLQLLPRDNKLSKIRDEFDFENVSTVDWDAAGDAAATIYQQLQSFISVTCLARKSSTKTSITIPAEAFKIGLFPRRGIVVVATTGRIFKIWNSENWQDANKIPNLRTFVEDAEEYLQRGE